MSAEAVVSEPSTASCAPSSVPVPTPTDIKSSSIPEPGQRRTDFAYALHLLGFDFWMETLRKLGNSMAHVVEGTVTDAMFYIPMSDERKPMPWNFPSLQSEDNENSKSENAKTAGFLAGASHMHVMSEEAYPHSHIYMGMLMHQSPSPRQFSDWFSAFLRSLDMTDEVVIPSIREQFPLTWAVVDRFYILQSLSLRPVPSQPLEFEPIVLSVPFNYESAKKMYPAILGFIGLLEVFRLVIAGDANAEKRIMATLTIDGRKGISIVRALKRGSDLLWMSPNGYPIPTGNPNQPFEIVNFQDPMFITINVAASLFFNLISIPLPTFRFELQFNRDIVAALNNNGICHVCSLPQLAPAASNTPASKRRLRFRSTTTVYTLPSSSAMPSSSSLQEQAELPNPTNSSTPESSQVVTPDSISTPNSTVAQENSADTPPQPATTTPTTTEPTSGATKSTTTSAAATATPKRDESLPHAQSCCCLFSEHPHSTTTPRRSVLSQSSMDRASCFCKVRGATISNYVPTVDLITIKGSDCTTVGGLLTPAYWALNLTAFFRLVKESWRIVITRDATNHGYLEIAMNFAFPTSGLLSTILKHTWNKFVSKHFLQESILFLRDFCQSAAIDLQNLKASSELVEDDDGDDIITNNNTNNNSSSNNNGDAVIGSATNK